MLALLRTGVIAAFALAFSLSAFPQSTFAASEGYSRPDLDDAAIKLEAQIKSDAGQVTKPIAQLRRDADAALQKGDARNGLIILGQIISLAPAESANWLRLARTLLVTRGSDDKERAVFQERATTSAYVAFKRARNVNDEADALRALGQSFADRKIWRPALDTTRLSLDRREVADVRAQYEQMRAEHGFRVLDYSVDSDTAAPRVCFQLSEDLPGKRIDLSPFVAVEGQDKPAISIDEKQVCIEGLQHGQRYSVTLRAGMPSIVKETLPKTLQYSVYVRDRTPVVHFTGKAYVLPRSGQNGIPVVSVNTRSVKVQLFRIGDRNIVETVTGSDFQTNLDPYAVERLGTERGQKVWEGQLAVDSTLNKEITTAFPVTQAAGDLAPGVYVMTAEATGPKPDTYSPVATQWFIVSDLGLTAFSGGDGINVFVHSLASAEVKAGVEVRLLSRSNEVLATRQTDANGRVAFAPGLARGEGGLSPAMIVASDTPFKDYAFLSLVSPAFDLTDRGVAGRPVAVGVDAFVYTERGVYRSGETVEISALLRDAQGVAVVGAPLTLIVARPDGVEYRRTVLADQGLGGRSLAVPLVGSAQTGTWRVRAYTDPKRPAIGETSFLVEDYVPDRLEFTITPKAPRISRTENAEIALDGRYLYGAPASALDLEGEIAISAADERAGFSGYSFGVTDEEVQPVSRPLEDLPSTDDSGKATITVPLGAVPTTTRPLEAKVNVRLAESGGRAVERSVTIPVTPDGPMIGVKPLFSGSSLGDGDTATFDVVLVDTDGKAIAQKGLHYELLKIESRYQYYKKDGVWNFEPLKVTKRVAGGDIDTAVDKPGRISAPVPWGRYRLEVSTEGRNGLLTSLSFDAGFYADATTDTPDLLEIALDKKEYQPGDTMTVAVTARAAGQVTLSIIGDGLLASQTQSVTPGTAKITVPVVKEWGTGAYVVATLRRPLDQQAQRMPGRAIGVQWFAVGRAAHSIGVALTLPQVIRPNTTLNIPIKLAGLTAGEQAHVTVAAVDVGILNLTGYKPPNAVEYYLGQRRLSSDIRDLYGQLIDGMSAVGGQIRTGGDAGAAALQASPPTQKPLALYSGVVTVGADGTAQVSFDIPDFAGTARVMAVAWSKDKVGNASGDVTIRDPVVLTATLPRFLLNGDHGSMHLDLDNVEGPAGDYTLAVRSEGLDVTGNAAPQKITLAAKQRKSVSVPLSASAAGTASVIVKVSGPGNFGSERAYALNVRPATQILTRRTVRTIAKGESVTLTRDMVADLVPGTGNVSIALGLSASFDVAAILKALDDYPFFCSEQTTSKAMPLLYVSELAPAAQLSLGGDVDQLIKEAIERLLSRQDSNGSFGLWTVGGDDIWLDSYVMDFLTRAREKNFVVSDGAFKSSLDRLKNFVGNAPEPSKDGGVNLAYALYVLARNGQAPIGDLRYFADARLSDFSTVTAKAQIAAALGMMGDKARAERVYQAALEAIPPRPEFQIGRVDYGSYLRDSATLVALSGEGGAPETTILQAVDRVDAANKLSPYTSTQEKAWLVLAARAIAKESGGLMSDIGRESHKGPLYRSYRAEGLAQPLKVTNTGDAPQQAVVSVRGAPIIPEPASEHGFKIERQTFDLEGKPIDITKVKQNQRIVVVLRVTDPQPQYARVVVADYLPAGLEIDNPRLVSSGDTGTLSWISDAGEPVNTEFRDDRFTAAFERKKDDPAVFTVAYVVRAVSQGTYVHPQAYVEDMYRPDRFGRTATGKIEVTGR